jgi:arylsulfatase A-like enzyme
MPGRTDNEWGRLDSALCVALLSCFVGSRLVWIIGNPESSQYWEEAYRWLAAEQLAAGAPRALLDYPADHYQGGSLVVSGLAAALVAIGVPSFAALKLVALAFSAGTCLALFAIGRVFFGRAVGLLCALIYLLGPPLVAFWGVVAMGFHAEAVLLSLLGIGLFLRLALTGVRGFLAWLLFGAISGLAIWFTPSAAIAVLACVVAWPLVSGRPRAAELAACAAGLCLGLAPWLAYNAAHDFAGVKRLLEVFGLEASIDLWREQGVLARAGDLLWRGAVQGLLDPGGAGAGTLRHSLLAAGVWLPAGLALAAAVRRAFETLRAGPSRATAGARGELVFLVYGVLFVAVYLASRLTLSVDPSPIQYRLLVPPAVLAIPPIAISAARAMRAGAARQRAARAACAIGLLSLAATTVRFALGHVEPGTPLSLERGHVVWGHMLVRKHGHDLERAVAGLDWLVPERREEVLGGIGWGLLSAYERSGRLDDLRGALGRLERDDRDRVLHGIRFWAHARREQLELIVATTDDREHDRARLRVGELAKWLGRPPVVLITLDTTRVDHLSCYGYQRNTTPKLDEFARRAVLFDRAWSTSSWTLPAHASLFTGMYPSRHGADYDTRGSAVLGDVIGLPVARHVRAGMLRDEASTLAELLAEEGYRTGAFVAGPWLHRSFGLLQGFEHKDDSVTSFGGRPAGEITAAALAWLEQVGSEEPYFLFVNYFDPHAPYEPVGRYAEFPRAAEPLAYDYDAFMHGEGLDEDRRAVLRDRYDAEIRDMDRELGRLLEAVLARPGGQNALIIVTADHGEALGEEGRLGHGLWLSEEQTRIPLLVRYPGDRGRGGRSGELIQLVDVPKLITQELGLALPDGGEALERGSRGAAFVELRREPTTALRFGAAYDRDLQAVIRWPRKLLRSDDGHETLLHLSSESLLEQLDQEPARASELRELLDAHANGAHKTPVAPPQADPELVEALRQLGYIE